MSAPRPAPEGNPHKGRTGIDRIRRAAGHSAAGLRAAYRHESAFRQECWLAVLGWPLAFWLGRDWMGVAMLGGALTAVLVVELLNSAIEAAVDRVSLELHPLAGRAKDMGSAAVMLSLLFCAAVWLAALWSRFA